MRWLIFVLVVLPLGCGQRNEFAPPPPPPVTVAEPQVEDVTLYLPLTGVTEAWKRVEIRARVQGFVQEILYQEGDFVEANKPLFLIDPAPFEAEVALAKASKKSAEADLKLATATVARLQQALKTNAVSKSAVDEAIAQRDVASAAVEVAQARLDQANLNLAYTDVRSPIAGRVTRRMVEIGDLVGVSDPTLLCTVVDDKKVYVFVHVSETQVLEFRRSMSTEEKIKGNPALEIDLGLEGEPGYPYKATLEYADPEIDRSTGTLVIRAVYDNKNRDLLGGTFVRVRVPTYPLENQLLLDERALGLDQRGEYVLVVNSKGVVEYRVIQVQSKEEDGRIVVTGDLSPDDRVIVNGVQRARPGTKVHPQNSVSSS